MTVYDGQYADCEGRFSDTIQLFPNEEVGMIFTEADRRSAKQVLGALSSGQAIDTEPVRARLVTLTEADSHQAQFLLDQFNQHDVSQPAWVDVVVNKL